MTPQERKEIYTWLLEKFRKDEKYEIATGFCAFLTIYEGEKANIETYVELIAQKPSRELIFGCYWWDIGKDTDGREKRIKALKKAIKQVNKLL